MKVTLNEERFGQCEEALLLYLIRATRRLLEEKEVPSELIYDITGDLVFEIGAVLDGSAAIGSEENPVLPFLSFLESEEERSSLFVRPGGTCLHEMAHGYVDGVFEEG